MTDDELLTFTLPRDRKAPLRFQGRIIAQHDTRWDDNNRRYEMALYQWRPKEGGWGYVCQRIGISDNKGETTRYKAEAVHHYEEVFRFFGFSDDAKELYGRADIDYAEEV